MVITNIEFKTPKSDINKELLLICIVTLDDVLKIRDILLCNGKYGYYIKFPTRKTNNYTYDITYPVDDRFKKYMEYQILAEYKSKFR